MFGSLLNIGSDLIDIATAPVKVGVEITRAVTKPIAEVANDVVEETKEFLDLDR